ncbi:MAG: hypothetical protein QM731_14475 [Chitinophagaceae bacterium]
MDVLILSKTHFGNNVCVGGMVLRNNQYVRLLNPGGWYQYADTEFNIGDIWDINFTISTSISEPHNEDVIINSKTYVSRVNNITQYILDQDVTIWRGSINNIFEGKIQWANSGAGFLSANFPDYPAHSIGFWLSDKPLSYNDDHYFYPTSILSRKKLKYKGLPDPIPAIPANTLLRVSLAKWWKPANSELEERCYLQLSGWYDDKK